MNPRPLGYEHPNGCLDPLPQSLAYRCIFVLIAMCGPFIATCAEPSHGVLVTGLVTGFDAACQHGLSAAIGPVVTPGT